MLSIVHQSRLNWGGVGGGAIPSEQGGGGGGGGGENFHLLKLSPFQKA